MSYPSSDLWASDPVLTAERRLWRGVLNQAYADAELSLGVESDEELFIDQIRARRFLRADTPGEKEELRIVCDYAEVPFDRVVKWARKHYAPVRAARLGESRSKGRKGSRRNRGGGEGQRGDNLRPERVSQSSVSFISSTSVSDRPANTD